MTAFLSLFSGIGGFDLGAYWAGLRFDEHYFSEVDPYAIEVFQRRFPDAIPLGDIQGIRGSEITADPNGIGCGNALERQEKISEPIGRDQPPKRWILAGGFPCQDISCAGKGAGITGERSGLWFEYARLIGELRPRFAVMENVGALTRRGLDAVLGSLAEIGYDAEWADIRASDVGAPHRRERIWIVAYPHPMHEPGSPKPREQFNRTAQSPRSSSNRLEAGDVLADASRLYVQGLDNESRKRESGGGCWWSTEPDVCGMADGLSSRLDGGLNDKGMDPTGCSSGKSENRVRKVWGQVASRLASQGQGSDEQLARELADALPEVSHIYSLGRGQESMATASRFVQRMRKACEANGVVRDASESIASAWESLFPQDQNRCFLAAYGRADWSSGEWLGVPRVAHNIPARVDRLKCLGNAIVPQIAYLIFSQPIFDEWRKPAPTEGKGEKR